MEGELLFNFQPLNVNPAVPVTQTIDNLNDMLTLPAGLEFGTAPLPNPPKETSDNSALKVVRRNRRNPIDQALQTNARINSNRDTYEATMQFYRKSNALPEGRIIGSSINMIDTKLDVLGTPTINNATLTTTDRKTLNTTSLYGTVNDELLGPLDDSTPCVKCGQTDCAGHFGYIPFHGKAIFHPFHPGPIANTLRCTCHSCGGLLISKDTYYSNNFHLKPVSKVLSELADFCEGISHNNNGKSSDGSDAPCCSKNPKISTSSMKEQGVILRVIERKKSKENYTEPFTASEVYNIFNRISDETAYLMGFRNGNHPRKLILFSQLVPPRAIRAPDRRGRDETAHHLSVQLAAIVKAANPEIRDGRIDIDPTAIYTAVRNTYVGQPVKKNTRNIVSITDTIQGRDAMLRKSIQGKRNDKSARGVAGPATDLAVDQIGIPRRWMNKITKPLYVNETNLEYCNELLRTRRLKRIKTLEGNSESIRYDRELPALRVGDIVYRYLQDGDRVCANRQPTLHRNSLLSYRVVGHDGDTVIFHEDVLGGMNMDRDGDEGNVWFIQEVTAESEGQFILNVTQNIMSRENCQPAVGCIMNTSTGVYILTGYGFREAYDAFDYQDLSEILMFKDQLKTLPQRLAKYGVAPNSGYGIFSMCLPENLYYNVGEIKIVEGVLISGRLRKSHVGTSPLSIVQIIYKNLGSEKAFEFLCNAPRLINKWIMEHGFSVSITDFFNLEVDEQGNQYNANQRILKEELVKIDVQLELISDDYNDPIAKEERERKIRAILDRSKEIGTKLAKQTLKDTNQIKIMTSEGAGTKGQLANIAQMMGAVGQQFYRGERLKPTLTGDTRTLPAFYPNDPSPEARGFIARSFYEGISPTDLFFMQAAGREGILDTALNISLTGFIQRSMTKSFENIIIANDGSVRNTNGSMFSTIYGGCGFDVAEKIRADRKGADQATTFLALDEIIAKINNQRGYILEKVNQGIAERRSTMGINYQEIIELPEVEPLKNYNPRPITRYEKSRIIGARAKQLDNNAPPLIDPGETVDSFKIAEMEYQLGILKIGVLRKYGDGSSQIVYPTLENITHG